MDLIENPLNNTALKKNGSGSDLGLFFTKPDAVKNFPLKLTTNPYPEDEELWQYEGEVFEMDTGFRLVYIADPKHDEHAKKVNAIGSLNLLPVDDIPDPTPKGWSYDR